MSGAESCRLFALLTTNPATVVNGTVCACAPLVPGLGGQRVVYGLSGGRLIARAMPRKVRDLRASGFLTEAEAATATMDERQVR